MRLFGKAVWLWPLVLLGVALPCRQASACTIAIPPPVTPMPIVGSPDLTPPQLFDAYVDGPLRGVERGSCLRVSEFSVITQASDDRTPSDQLAYRVEALRGDVPLYYGEPMAYLHFVWVDDPDEPLDFEFRVRAVDSSGNESNPIDLRVEHPGAGTEGGCQFTPGGLGANSGAAPASAALLLALAWRARRSHGCGQRSACADLGRSVPTGVSASKQRSRRV